jgi:hypothetical protein
VPQVTLSHYHYLVPPHLREAKPSYFIVGGLVFTVCTDPYLLQRYGSLGGAPVRLMGKSYYGVKNESDEQVGGRMVWWAGWLAVVAGGGPGTLCLHFITSGVSTLAASAACCWLPPAC